MIIRCPECSTGFRLSNERISEDPVKVRCSKCEHVFQVGLLDGQTTLFATSGEKLEEDKQRVEPETGDQEAIREGEEASAGASGEYDSEIPEEGFEETGGTQMGTAAAGYEDEHSDGDEPESEYDPFPHAGSEAEPKSARAIAEEQEDETPGTEATAQADPEGEPTEKAAPDDPTVEKSLDDLDDLDDPEAAAEAEEASGGEESSDRAVSVHPEHSGQPAEFEGEQTAIKKPDEPEGDDELPGEETIVPEESDRESASPPEQDRAPASARAEVEAQSSAGPETDGTEPEGGRPGAGSERATTAGARSASDSVGASSASPGESGAAPPEGEPSDASNAQGPPGGGSSSQPTAQAAGAASGAQVSGGSSSMPDQGTPPQNSTSPAGAPNSGAGGSPPAGSGPRELPGGPSGPGSPPGGSSPASKGGASSGTASESGGTPGGTPGAGRDGGASGLSSDSTPATGAGGIAEPSSPVESGLGGTSSAAEELALDEVDRVDAEQFGGSSGLQTAANIALVLFVLANTFLVVVAAQNKWFVDFKKFGQMVSVAFQGGEYSPRDEWTTTETKVVRRPKNPIEFKNVVAQTITLEEAPDDSGTKPSVVVLKGEAENLSDTKHLGVKIRGIIYDRDGKVKKQAKTALGADIPTSKIRSATSVDELTKLTQKSPVELRPDATEPFTIIFDSVPHAVREGANVDYRVEVADSYTPGESK